MNPEFCMKTGETKWMATPGKTVTNAKSVAEMVQECLENVLLWLTTKKKEKKKEKERKKERKKWNEMKFYFLLGWIHSLIRLLTFREPKEHGQ